MVAAWFLQNSHDSSGTWESADIPATTQNFLKGFSFVANPINWAFRIAPYEVVFTRECANIGEASLSIEDTKDPSAEASLVGGKFFTDIWENDGRGMAHEIIKKSEKDSHDSKEATKAAEKAAELERRIGIA